MTPETSNNAVSNGGTNEKGRGFHESSAENLKRAVARREWTCTARVEDGAEVFAGK
jgi:hypothetical protein